MNSSSKLFSLIRWSSEGIDYLWERAVLSKGVYFTKASVSRFNLLSTRLSKNNIERDHSWKRLLRISVVSGTDWEKRQEFVKAVFDDSIFDSNNIKDSLKEICSKALEDDGIEEWRKCLIQYQELFKECEQGFIVKNADEIILLQQSQRNHYHSELYSKVLELELKKIPGDLRPFKQLQYEPVKSRDHSSFVSIGGWVYEGSEYDLEVWYESNVYCLLFYGDGLKGKASDIIGVLEGEEFVALREEYDGYEDYHTKYEARCKTQEDVIEKLRALCEGLKGLIDE